MGITKYKTKSGKIKYRAFIMRSGVRTTKVFNDQLDAAVWYDAKEKELTTGEVPDDIVGHGDMLFRDASDRFIIEARRNISAGQIKNYEQAQMQLVRSFGEKAKLSTIKPQDVSAHILKRMNEDGVGPSIVRKECSLIRLVYTKAKEWGIRIQSPELEIVRPRQRMKSREEKLDRVLKPEELQAIFREAKNRQSNLYHFLLFLLFTGMRPSEAAHLYWQRLPVKEEKEAMKKIQPVGYVDLQRGGFSKVGTKTESRFVPAHPIVVDLLQKISRTEGKKLVFLDDRFIGRDRAYRYYRRSMQTTLHKAILEDGNPLRGDVDFYSFRHTVRSRMANCGIPTEIAETIIGHQDKSFKFTYIHLEDSDLIREMAKLHYSGVDDIL